MRKVKRFNFKDHGGYGDGFYREEDENGEYVESGDYDDLHESVEWLMECEYVKNRRKHGLTDNGILEINDCYRKARKIVEDLL